MNIFDHLNNIQTIKEGKIHYESYTPYMINRWMSHYSDNLAIKINSTVNTFGVCFNKEEHYKLMCTITPKTKYSKRLNYIKKAAKKDNEKEDIKTLASNLQISQRELKEMLEFKRNIH
jgi:hypothetical protein